MLFDIVAFGGNALPLALVSREELKGGLLQSFIGEFLWPLTCQDTRVHEFSTSEIVYWSVMWCVAFLSSIARTFSSTTVHNLVYSLAHGSSSAFISLGILTVWDYYDGGSSFSVGFSIGISCVLGVFSKEAEVAAKAIVEKFLKIDFKDEEPK